MNRALGEEKELLAYTRSLCTSPGLGSSQTKAHRLPEQGHCINQNGRTGRSLVREPEKSQNRKPVLSSNRVGDSGTSPTGFLHPLPHHWAPGDSALKPKRQESRLWPRCTQHRDEVGRSRKPELRNGHPGHVTPAPAYVALARSLSISALMNEGGSR